MRTSAFVAAALAGVASAWPKFSGTASAISGSGGIYPTGSGIIYHPSSSGVYPSGSGAPSYTRKHYSTGGYSHSQGGATGSGQVGPTGTGHGGGSGGHTTLTPTTITITGNVPSTTTKTVEITNTITTTISKLRLTKHVSTPID